MAASRDLILGARIGFETRRDPMRKMMIAFAAAFAVCTATMTSGTTAAFARGGGSFGGGTHGFGGGGFGGHGFAMGRGDIAHFSGGFGQLGRGFGDRRFDRFGFGPMDTRVGPTTITATAPVRCPLLTATPGLATDIQHRNLASALHPQWVRCLGLGPATTPPYAARDGIRQLSQGRCDAAHCLPSSALIQN